MLTAEAVDALMRLVLFTDEEIQAAGGEAPAGTVKASGVVATYGFHPGRLAEARPKVVAMLRELPDEFFVGGGGGWTFLNLCQTKAGRLWGEHRDCDSLLCLAFALGLGHFQLPRDLWGSLPGGMPYLVFDLSKEA